MKQHIHTSPACCVPPFQVFPGTAHTHEAQLPTNITSEISVKPKMSAGAKLMEELKRKQ